MAKLIFILIYTPVILFFLGCKEEVSDAVYIRNEIRPPAYPLIMIDPNMNAWSMADTLYNDHVRHWSGRKLPLVGALRVDGEIYRFMGTSAVAMKPLIPISKDGEWEGKYTFIRPESDWVGQDFDDSKWQTGKAAFGTRGEFNVQTIWPTPDIWIRREITLADSIPEQDSLILIYSHDETFELYINGIQLVKTGHEWHQNVEVGIPDQIRKTFSDGKIMIAAHCKNMEGAGLVDFGIYIKKEQLYLERAAFQKSVDVQATQTLYTFECGDVALELNFISPFLVTDLELVSSPFNYISCQTVSLDGEPHDIQLYLEASPYWASNEDKRMNKPAYSETKNMLLVKTGNIEQKLLNRDAAGWGYFCIGGEKQNSTISAGYAVDLQEEFTLNGRLINDGNISDNSTIAICQNLGKTSKTSGHVIIGYDDISAISYFGDNLRPYWNRNDNKTIEQIFADANSKYDDITTRCRILDYEIMTKARNAGGKEYAELCALAYRQTIAANKLVQRADKELLYFNRELGTVDVFMASAPLFLYFNPELVKALMNPLFEYSETGKWPKAYPAHDLGLYPRVCQQDFFDLPVEEAGNMLILTAAVTAIDGNGAYADKHWEILSKWNDYLIQNGIDTKDQPSTDVFTSVIPHNANLSIKAIMGVASYAYMAKILDKNEISENYFNKAREMASEWEKLSNAGDHYRIAFHQPDSTWSQKYNLLWNNVLNLGIFPDSIHKKEIDYYKTKQNKYGLPLDSRDQFAKSDWISWIAAMAEDKEGFQEFIRPLHRFMNETTDRVPMADLINTDTATHRGFRARSVVGAYYMKLLKEKLNTKNNENKE
ncbi:glutaminase family protein [uncultured Proteiniphilum sp.]|uniref:glutaminase family protein n=1 Tax=uncultured Proteiniphilum sp. TaxID=497637 RepID=UPI00261AFAB0|nr:glutaminase family protein [uncultured Proteiniphilum sp.]